jgi:predicted amidohydrolase
MNNSTSKTTMRIALATTPFPKSLADGITITEEYIINAAEQKADVVCFPESFLPGMRGLGIDIEPHNPIKLKQALNKVCELAKDHSIYVIMPMDWDLEGQILNLAFCISDKGEILGRQTKIQIDPSEEGTFIAGHGRSVFDIKGVKVGIVICHEGFRYPETVRWAACAGAQVVFHPHCNGSDKEGVVLSTWCAPENPYFEKAMMCRALENTIFFASVNYAFKYQESATSIINPTGKCVAHAPYSTAHLLVHDIEIQEATGLLAKRFAPHSYN